MNVKMKRYAKALVAFVLAFVMVSEAWGGVPFVTKAENGQQAEVNAVAETVNLSNVPEFPTKTENDWKDEELPAGNEYKLSTQDAFVSFARASRAHTFEGKTVYLASSFTYTERTFAGIGTVSSTGVSFCGTFDGCGKTITGFKIGGAGIFANVNGATIKNLVIDNATMTTKDENRGLLVSEAYGNSVIENVTVTDSTMNCSADSTEKTQTYVNFGFIVAVASGKATISGTTVTGCTMNLGSTTWASNVGGIAGSLEAGGTITNCRIKDTTITGKFAQANEANPNQNDKGDLPEGVNPNNAKISENIGGVVGCVGGVFNAQNVEVDNVDISMKNVLKNVGGFVGYVTYKADSENATTFTSCSVKNANITSTQFIWDPGFEKENDGYVELPTEEKHYYHNIAGFVACVDKKATFTECSVDNTVTQTQTRYRCGGGLIGSTFSYKKDSEGLSSKGIINVSKCSVTRTTIKTGNSRNCNVGGGLVALLAEGSTVTDCYVYDYTNTDNPNSLYMGGLIGDVYDIQKGSLANGKTVVKNCYVGKTYIQGFNFIGEVIGDTDDGVNLEGFSNLLYCKTDTKVARNLDRDNPSIASFDAVKGKEHDSFTNREIAFMLNAGGADNEISTDIWTQGTEHPVFKDPKSKDMPIRKVIFQKEGRSYAYFTNGEGKLDEYPKPDEGYDWWDFKTNKKFDENFVFTENSWVYQREAIVSISDFSLPENVNVTDFYIETKKELIEFKNLSKNHTFEGKTIHLMADINWGGEEGGDWSSTGTKTDGIGSAAVPFGGTFDGHGHTISNFYSTSHGLFMYLGYVSNVDATGKDLGIIAQPTVKNFTMSKATVVGDNGSAIVVARFIGNPENSSLNNQVLNVHVVDSTMSSDTSNTGIIAGRNQSEHGDAITISGCTVTNSTLECTATAYKQENSEDVLFINYGFILARDLSQGYSRVIGCTVTNSKIISETCTVTQVGGILGYVNAESHIEECFVTENTLIDCSRDAAKDSKHIGGIVGFANAIGTTVKDCTVSDTEIRTSGIATNVGMIAGQFKGKTISGAKVANCVINSQYNGTQQSGLMGGVVGLLGSAEEISGSLPQVFVTDCKVEHFSINVASRAYSLAGLIGRITKYADATVKDSAAKDIKITNTYTTVDIPSAFNYGGAIGNITESANVLGVTVEGVQLNSKNAYRNVGGFVGMVQGKKPTTFEKCKVTAYKNEGTTIGSKIYDGISNDTANWKDGYYSFQVGGFAGLVVSDSSFTECMVEDMDIYARERFRGVGGIVAATRDLRSDITETEDANVYKEGKIDGIGVVTINRCTSNNMKVSSGGASYFLGGVVGKLSEGSSITNCLVSGFSHSSTGNNVGAVIGQLANTHTDTSAKAVIKNNYVQYCSISVDKYAGIVMGGAEKDSTSSATNNYYYNTTLSVASTNTAEWGKQYSHATAVTDPSILTNKELAYNLNTTDNTEPNSGSWAQGATNPIIADEKNAAVAYVTYLRYNGDDGYKGMEYLKFPINPDGTINYKNGTRRYLTKTDITDASQVNRQTTATDQETIELKNNDGTWKHQKEEWHEEACTYPSEPSPNSGRIWQYPEGKITTDVTITQVEKTAWDFNGDTKLSVSDLVRLKKSEEANYNSNVCKASIIGTMLTGTDKTEQANIRYDDNKDLKQDGYLPSYRLRRVILTPPSTEVSVLSYNLYYEGKSEYIPDATRQSAIMQMLGLTRPEADEKDNVFDDNTRPKADIIALQEVTADYWHTTLYTNYLKPYSVDKNGDGDTEDPGEKTYYTYEHFGRGRYGHVFYSNEGKAFDGDSYTLLLYNTDKYGYKSGDSGTIYLSDTPTVASHGWGTEIPHTSSILDAQRAANWAIFTNKQTGERFMFVNLHLSHNETDIDRQAVRMKQIELILRKVKEIVGQEKREIGLGEASGGLPIIIAGDFNAFINIGIDAYSYSLEQGYQDARYAATDSSELHGSFNNWTTTDETKYAYGDHFLVNDRARVRTYEVIDGDETGSGDTFIDYNLYEDKYHYSDHCPIRASIDIGSDYIRSTTVDEDLNPNLTYNEIYGFE